MTATNVVFTPSIKPKKIAHHRAMAAVGKLAGVSLASPLDEVRLTQNGVACEAIDRLKDLGAPNTTLRWIINPRTLSTRKNHQKRLTPEETQRWLRAAKVHALALEVFGEQEKANAWLQKPKRKFGSQSASVLVQYEAGAQLVKDTLNQIDSGYLL